MFAADVQIDILGRSLLIAAVIVTPYGIIKVRQVRAARRERLAAEAAATAPPGPARPALEDVIGEISASRVRDGAGTVTIPHDVTVAGADAEPGVVDTLVRDALRRSGLVATAELDTPAGRVLEVRPSGSDAQR
jgi:hypothetical protein